MEMRRAVTIQSLVVCLMTLTCAAWCAAQQPQIDLTAEFGFQGQYVSGRWTPITVSITSGDRAIDGMLVVEFPQDKSQRARIMVPFATTPNRVTPIEVVAAIPPECPEVRFSIMRPGRRPETWRYAAIPFNAEQLPAGWPESTGKILSVGTNSARFVIGRRVAPEGEDFSEELEPEDAPPVSTETDPSALAAAAIENASKAGELTSFQRSIQIPDRLPRAWMAYDGIAAMIVNVNEATRVDPRAIQAVREWVLAGGHLVLIVGGAGEEWREWIPAGPGGSPVSVDAVARVEVSETRIDNVSEASRLAPAVTARAMQLTDVGREMGWRTSWSLRDASRGGLLAEGPIGLGWVVVLGADPERMLAQVSVEGLDGLWRLALEHAMSAWTFAASPVQQQHVGFMLPWSRSSTATSHTLQRLATVPPAGYGAFVVICVAFVVLAALLGPVDALVLKAKRLSQISWITAFGWIGLASLLALAIPPLLRAGPTTVNRASCVDVLAVTGSPIQFESACSGIFTGRRARLNVADMNDATWMRGVSAMDYDWQWGPRSTREARAALESIQGIGPSPSNVVPQISAGIWTFRTFMEERASASSITGRIVREGTQWRIEIQGLPPEGFVSDVVLRADGRWHSIPSNQASGGARVTWSASDESGQSNPPANWDGANMAPTQQYIGPQQYWTQPLSYTTMIFGASRRHAAIEHYASTEGFGVVQFCHTSPEPYRDVGVGSVGRTETVYRIVLPVVDEVAGDTEESIENEDSRRD